MLRCGPLPMAAVNPARLRSDVYSLTGTGVGRACCFPQQATGSLDQAMASVVVAFDRLVAQPFADARYFQPRPSAAGYDPMAAAGSNQARTNPDLARAHRGRRSADVAAREGIAPTQVPSRSRVRRIRQRPRSAHLARPPRRIQVARVARARGVPKASKCALLDAATEAPPSSACLGQAARERAASLEPGAGCAAGPTGEAHQKV
jgi:K+-transporting ATPase ATPase C chain